MKRYGEQQIGVRVLLFGAAREAAGQDEILLNTAAPASVATIFQELLRRYPQLDRFRSSLLFAVNQEYAPADREVHDGDEMALLPPVSGGAPESADRRTKDFYELTTEPIDVGEVARRVVPPECGATVTLDGYVREYTHGRARTLYLVYEAYLPMALLEMQRLGARVREHFEITHVGIVHRTGRLEIGETSVVISVSAPHRHAAFKACEWIIKELKRTVPIWKKEFFEGGEVWVENESVASARKD